MCRELILIEKRANEEDKKSTFSHFVKHEKSHPSKVSHILHLHYKHSYMYIVHAVAMHICMYG